MALLLCSNCRLPVNAASHQCPNCLAPMQATPARRVPVAAALALVAAAALLTRRMAT
jgi:predicted amidophosphoribosyltransferase